MPTSRVPEPRTDLPLPEVVVTATPGSTAGSTAGVELVGGLGNFGQSYFRKAMTRSGSPSKPTIKKKPPPKTPVAPTEAFVMTPQTPFLLPEVVVVASTSTKSIVGVTLSLAARLLGGVVGMLFPTSLGVEPDVRRLKPVAKKPSTPKVEETVLEEVVVSAPEFKVGKTTSVDYFANIFETDLDLVSQLTLSTKEPKSWTSQQPDVSPLSVPSQSPSLVTQPLTLATTALSPASSTLPSALTATQAALLPLTSPIASPLPALLSPKLQPSLRRLTTGKERKTSPQRPSLTSPLTRDLTTPIERPLESPPKGDACKCPKPAKAKEKKKEKRDVCYVTLTKERRNPDADVVKRWRIIKCQ